VRSTLILLGLALTASTAHSQSNYTTCVDTRDPPACIARQALDHGWLRSDDVTDAIIRHGLLDLVPRRSSLLARVAGERMSGKSEVMKLFGQAPPNGSPQRRAETSRPRVFIAAIALLTAARHQADPFTDPTVQALIRKAGNDPMIPFLAMDFWYEIIDMHDTAFSSVTFAGLGEIWKQVLANKDRAPEYAEALASSLAFSHELGDEPKRFWIWFANRPEATPKQKEVSARLLVSQYSAADEASKLIDSIDTSAPGIDVSDVRASIAILRLKSKYDPELARFLIAYEFDLELKSNTRFRQTDARRIQEAFHESGAARELRVFADEYVRRAQTAGPGSEALRWYAAASDCYLLAGDREKAREIARLGFPFVPDAVMKNNTGYEVFAGTSPRWLAAKSNGQGTAPVISLYRTGAIDEALKFGYLSGIDRYRNAPQAGEPRDPQWVIDDDSRMNIIVMVLSAISEGDSALKQRVLEVLKKNCKGGYAGCYDEWLTYLAALAASSGDEAEMKRALTEQAKDIDESRSGRYDAVDFAAHYAHALELLATPHIPASH
jgi:hypothetical protein